MRPMRSLTMLMAGATVVVMPTAVAEAACTISTTTVNFGTHNVFSASPDDRTGQIACRCTVPRPPLVTIQLDKGGAPSFNPEILSYNLYLDSTRTTIWGDGTGGSQTYTRSNPCGTERQRDRVWPDSRESRRERRLLLGHGHRDHFLLARSRAWGSMVPAP